MAQLDLHSVGHSPILHILAAPFVAIGNFMVTLGEANSRSRQASYLYSLSDRELADIGIKREDIAQYVFGGYFA
ncbi:protein of unknown function [Shimia gijangensis]|uniref:YjiS-like domain-containing protein n=1 Tax=Shimia gijangensis TaxID=1470563 RepID=A0A1M6R906_9RHOB|nr:DUF1127 domain-containing protein [Shimia gijangensis]SHK28920.1 protein of unknown function [Shimia gijangensis]